MREEESPAASTVIARLTQPLPPASSSCLHTAELVMAGLPMSRVEVEENIRETLGEDTCDARR